MIDVYLAYTQEEEDLRAKLRSYFAGLITPEVEAELAKPDCDDRLYRQLIREMGNDGWLGIGWPAKYGGKERPPIEQFIFFDEAQRAGAPVANLTVNTVGPTIMRYGSSEQKDKFLPGILTGEILFAIGYTEPDAGTDLASLKTSAKRDGAGWIINGHKVFTSNAHHSDYVWLAARTAPDRHQGISVFVVPTSAKGFRVTPIYTLGGIRTNSTFYDDVQVDGDALVGDANDGWTLITTQLNHERVALARPGLIDRHFSDVLTWAKAARLPDGQRVLDQEWVRHNLARVFANIEVLKLMAWETCWETSRDVINQGTASATKVFGTEAMLESFRLLTEVVGQAAYIRASSSGAALSGALEWAYRRDAILTFGGGTQEVQRDIIARAGLGVRRRSN